MSASSGASQEVNPRLIEEFFLQQIKTIANLGFTLEVIKNADDMHEFSRDEMLVVRAIEENVPKFIKEFEDRLPELFAQVTTDPDAQKALMEGYKQIKLLLTLGLKLDRVLAKLGALEVEGSFLLSDQEKQEYMLLAANIAGILGINDEIAGMNLQTVVDFRSNLSTLRGVYQVNFNFKKNEITQNSGLILLSTQVYKETISFFADLLSNPEYINPFMLATRVAAEYSALVKKSYKPGKLFNVMVGSNDPFILFKQMITRYPLFDLTLISDIQGQSKVRVTNARILSEINRYEAAAKKIAGTVNDQIHYVPLNPALVYQLGEMIGAQYNDLMKQIAKESNPDEKLILQDNLKKLNAAIGLLNSLVVVADITHKNATSYDYIQIHEDLLRRIQAFADVIGVDNIASALKDVLIAAKISDPKLEKLAEQVEVEIKHHLDGNTLSTIPVPNDHVEMTYEDLAGMVDNYLSVFKVPYNEIQYEDARILLQFIRDNNIRVNTHSKQILQNVEDPFDANSTIRVVAKRLPMMPAYNYEKYLEHVDKLLPSDVGVLGVVVVSDTAWNDCKTSLSAAVASANTWIADNDPSLPASYEIDAARTTATQVIINEKYNGEIENEIKIELVKGEVPEVKPKNWSTEGQPTDKIVSQLPSDWFNIKETPPVDPDRLEIVKGVLHALAKASPNNTIMISNLSGHRTVAVELAKIAQDLNYKTEFNREDGTYRTVMGRLTEFLRDDSGQFKPAPWSPGWKRH